MATLREVDTLALALPEVVKGPGPIRLLVDQLKRRSYVRVRHRPQPAAFS